MACAKCDFYMPKESSAGLRLEGKKNLVRLLQEIPLGEAEQAAVEEGISAHETINCKACRCADTFRTDATALCSGACIRECCCRCIAGR
jgi:hypothetical protein